MTIRAADAPGFWPTVALLLGAARRRAAGRLSRQRALLRLRGGTSAANWSVLGFAFVVCLAGALNLAAAFDLLVAYSAGQRVEADARGAIVVEDWFLDAVGALRNQARQNPSRGPEIARILDKNVRMEAARLVRTHGGDENALAARLHAAAAPGARQILIRSEDLDAETVKGGLADALGLFVLLFWCAMLVCQGEGADLDTQRRRHPMWEWLFSHPAPPGAIFLAEMIAPIAANPIYLTAPLLPGLLYGSVYGWAGAVGAALLVGVPAAVALACLGKAIEINLLLRFAPRARGAAFGLMGWFGYASMVAFLLLGGAMDRVVTALAGLLAPLANLPWPRLPILVGQRADGSASFVLGVSVCALVSALAILGAVGASLRSARRGLAGEIVAAAPTPVARVSRRVPFGRAPLLRKELLWFRRDGSAVTQVVLIPLTMAAFQLFNLRGLLSDAQDAWNYLCGAAILFGSYFLFVLGPRSLASEGQALWIAMTWPRGLESLLKAKAQLWALLASAIVTTIFVYAAWRFPASLWKIALVGLGWFVFARSLAEKSVTLATVASPSGEPERPSRGRSMAVSLGMLSFAVGVLSQQWSLAIFGIGCSVMTAAAMWQNFRFRLPYLYDPWSEALPPPPTLMHAMIGIGALVEGASVLSGLALWRFGRDSLPVANALIYAICAIAVALAMARFLAGRGVPTGDVFLWRDARPGRAAPERWLGPDGAGRRRVAAMVAAGVGLGAALGVLAHGYVALLRGFPCFGALIAEAEARIDAIPHARASYFATAVLFAPFAEEYLFRGLLYRALDREWGGWRAVLGSAGFFAIYHPALSWAPVTALGVANAILFKRTGRLAPAIALHIAYNAVVLGWRFG